MKVGVAAQAAGSALAAAPKNIAISSDNGLRACARAIEMLAAGQDTLDAVIAGVIVAGAATATAVAVVKTQDDSPSMSPSGR
jgi:hypothetical protein